MQTTYAKRLRQAIEHAGMSQAELARRIGLKSGPQAVQYLADDKNNSRGSRHTAAFAQALGVDAVWLATGAGAMLGSRAREPGAAYELEAERLARDISALRPELLAAVRQIVSALARPRSQASRTVKLERGESSGRETRRTDKARSARRAA